MSPDMMGGTIMPAPNDHIRFILIMVNCIVILAQKNSLLIIKGNIYESI